MRPHESFEWHEEKAEENYRKHGVSFDEAAEVLMDNEADLFHCVAFDEDHSSAVEDRFITVGSHPADRNLVLFIVWTTRGEATRIISARKTTQAERRKYESQSGQ